MSVPYKLFYRLGFHPWEDLAVADTEPDAIAKLLKFDEHWYRLRRQ